MIFCSLQFSVVSGSILVWYPSPDLSAEQEIVHKIAELSEKLHHANTLNDQRKTDLQVRERFEKSKINIVVLQAVSTQFTSLIKLVKEHQVWMLVFPNKSGCLVINCNSLGPVRGQQFSFEQETRRIHQAR